MRDGFGRLVIGDVIVALNGKPVRKEADLFGERCGCWGCGEGCFFWRPAYKCWPSARPQLASCSLASLPSLLHSRPTTHFPAIPPNQADTLDGCKEGDAIQVEVLRGGTQRKVLTVHLAERQPLVSE